ncbi:MULTISPECIES: hypothetical protein [unclassified Amycolatopsis]|uniref:hypothetical protein n=1 Tax=unclassified Amycolatopsis TaxID=2618356 RepID=UPI00106E34EB|nr:MULTISPECIES: hypothetical protein [unclassified Amycolatopsis]
MVEVREVRRLCYDFARSTGGTLTDFRVPTVTPNFWQAVIEYFDRTISVVAANDAPVVALARPRSFDFTPAREWGPLEFVDEPDLIAVLAQIEQFQVLTPADLDRSFVAKDWPHLTRSDVAYWKPSTVGEALFNYWD